MAPLGVIWNMPRNEKKIYITFDDGPTPEITEQVLSILSQYNAKATFFCLGKNVSQYPDIYNKILVMGHETGNHTQNHLNGWKTKNTEYFDDIQQAEKSISSKLFRPPYGRISASQILYLKKYYKIIMWEVLSGDYMKTLNKEKCLNNVLNNTREGSIVVFHDSVKAADKVLYALPRILDNFTERGFMFDSIRLNSSTEKCG